MNIDNDGKLRQRFSNKRVNAKKEGIEFELTFKEYCQLVEEAGLISSQLGFKGENYVLARYNDEGPYKVGNCRFITQKENMAEQKRTEKQREVSKRNVRIMNEKNRNDPDFGKKVSEGIRKSNHHKERTKITKINKEMKGNNKDKRYCKEHNSQFGTFWITNGKDNKKWRDSYGDLPLGYKRGRSV